ALSLENCGVAERFYPGTNAESGMNTFYETISTPVITDMDFAYPHTSDIVNTGYSTLFAGSDAIVLARYPAGAGSINSKIDAVTRTGSRSFDETFSVVSRPENSFVPKLWAYTKIRKLMDRMVVFGETDALVSEITNLSLEFGFVTPYTSLFVEVPVIDKISEATTESGTLAEPEPMPTAAPAYAGPEGGEECAEDAAVTEEAPPMPEATTRAPGKSEATDEGNGVVYAPEAAPAEAEVTATKKKCPGFGALFAIAGLAAVAYLVRRRS
ncbi:MAG TPA: PGF-CTERM sorting domain-containing protein, partial [Methanosarcinales archaeon]|nr:PGF-CTERM sorting domain-containing protein [Methanosarcinales archaeon]